MGVDDQGSSTQQIIEAEAARIAALARLRVLDTPPEEVFETIVDIAAAACETPMALVTLIDRNRQFFKAERGFGVRETTLQNSVCATAIGQAGVFVVPDLSADPAFSGMEIVTGAPHVRFYAGAPLTTAEGVAIGMVCVLDTKPRPQGLADSQRATLSALARQAMRLLEMRQHDIETARRESNIFNLASRAPVGIAVKGLDGLINFVNGEYCQLLGRSVEDLIGQPIQAFVHEADRPAHAQAVARAGQGAEVIEERYVKPDGAVVWAENHISVTRDGDGAPIAIVELASNVTESRRTASALEASERKFKAIADAMPQMVWSALPDGHVDYYNRRWYDFTGAAEGSTEGDGWTVVIYPDDLARMSDAWRQSLATGSPYDIEYRLRHRAGEYRWVLARALPIRNAQGEIERWFGTCTDIEDIKRTEEQRGLLSQELSHRIKNIFAVVGGLVSLTARGDPAAAGFAQDFRERLNALTVAHEYVRPELALAGSGGTTVQGLIALLLKPYVDAGQQRFVFRGDDAPIGPKTATALALVMHEQATNAVKYGALSNEDGRIVITGARDGDDYRLVWCEERGPPVAGEPERRGFGTHMAARSAAGQLGGRIEHEWPSHGLIVRLVMPAANLAR